MNMIKNIIQIFELIFAILLLVVLMMLCGFVALFLIYPNVTNKPWIVHLFIIFVCLILVVITLGILIFICEVICKKCVQKHAPTTLEYFFLHD